jgi:hypothetical protein
MTMSQHYSDPRRANDPHALPNIEVFYAEAGELEIDGAEEPSEAGWYWWACFPGCVPDGEACGPFASAEKALRNAREGEDFADDLDNLEG